MAKGSLFEDTLEQLAELGSTTAKKSVQQVAATFNPLNLAKKISGEHTSSIEELSRKTAEVKRSKDYTPLDFKKLQENFKDREKIKMDRLRNLLFHIVKREDEKILEHKDIKAAQKKRQEEFSSQEKKIKEKEKKKQQGDIPIGRIRRSIFSAKKVAQREHAEFKPASGKQ